MIKDVEITNPKYNSSEEVARAKKQGLFIGLLPVDKLLEYEDIAANVKMF